MQESLQPREKSSQKLRLKVIQVGQITLHLAGQHISSCLIALFTVVTVEKSKPPEEYIITTTVKARVTSIFPILTQGTIYRILYCQKLLLCDQKTPYAFYQNFPFIFNENLLDPTSLSRVRLFSTPWTPGSSVRFSRQEYWSGLPFPSPGNFLTQGSNPGLPHCRQTLYCLSHQGSPTNNLIRLINTPSLLKLKQPLNMNNPSASPSDSPSKGYHRSTHFSSQSPPPLLEVLIVSDLDLIGVLSSADAPFHTIPLNVAKETAILLQKTIYRLSFTFKGKSKLPSKT